MQAKRRYRIVGQLGSNRRLASVSVDAALLYLLALPYGDREGRLLGEPGDLIDEVCPAFARRHAWTEASVDALVVELVTVGLWERWSGPDGRVIGICRWTDHQHPSKLAEERPSRLSPPPTPPQESNRTEAEAKLMAEPNRTEPNGTVRNRSAAASRTQSHDAQRLLDAWRLAFRQRNAEFPEDPIPTPGLRIFEVEQIAQEVADAMEFFPDEASLVAEVRRLCRCWLERGLVLGPVVMRQLGKSFPGTSAPDPAPLRRSGNGHHDGPVHASVAAQLPKIGKEIR